MVVTKWQVQAGAASSVLLHMPKQLWLQISEGPKMKHTNIARIIPSWISNTTLEESLLHCSNFKGKL